MSMVKIPLLIGILYISSTMLGSDAVVTKTTTTPVPVTTSGQSTLSAPQKATTTASSATSGNPMVTAPTTTVIHKQDEPVKFQEGLKHNISLIKKHRKDRNKTALIYAGNKMRAETISLILLNYEDIIGDSYETIQGGYRPEVVRVLPDLDYIIPLIINKDNIEEILAYIAANKDADVGIKARIIMKIMQTDEASHIKSPIKVDKKLKDKIDELEKLNKKSNDSCFAF